MKAFLAPWRWFQDWLIVRRCARRLREMKARGDTLQSAPIKNVTVHRGP
jgi:hypothetical protein